MNSSGCMTRATGSCRLREVRSLCSWIAREGWCRFRKYSTGSTPAADAQSTPLLKDAGTALGRNNVDGNVCRFERASEKRGMLSLLTCFCKARMAVLTCASVRTVFSLVNVSLMSALNAIQVGILRLF